MEIKKYIYRHDRLEELLQQRINDPVLRGRRSDGAEEFGHWQIKKAHLSIKNDNQAIYTLSFWRTFEDLKKNKFSIGKGVIIQRVCENHPGLQKYQRGDDEFIPNEEAWLYWATLNKLQNNKNRAPIGIPHNDIEVLLPNGQWVAMDEVAVLSKKIDPSWNVISIHNIHETRNIYWKFSFNPCDTLTVLIRQPYWFFTNSYGNECELAEIVDAIINNQHSFILHPRKIRWFYAWENKKEILAEELFVKIKKNRLFFFCWILNFLYEIKFSKKWKVIAHRSTRTCKYHEIENLYKDFELTEILCRGERWVNPIISKDNE